jgi:hypothetical protein
VKRIAYVGASGPIKYDYKHTLNSGYPNPILESPLGLMAVYDEIVFLHESICPKTMQKLDFIRFLSDREDIQDYETCAAGSLFQHCRYNNQDCKYQLIFQP